MEVTCWHCHAVFDPETTGKRCPHCGHHSEAWLARLRFAAVDFLGPLVLLSVGLFQLSEDLTLSILFVVGSVVWAGFIVFQDIGDWVEGPTVDQLKPPMPDSWKSLASAPCPRDLEASSGLNPPPATSQDAPMSGVQRLTWTEQLLLGSLAFGSILYVVSRWNRIQDIVLHGKISVAPLLTPAVILSLIIYAVRRTHADELILREGVLTPGILTGWYDKSTYSRTGYHSIIRIRYIFWTESGQKFEGSGTLTSEPSAGSLSINQEPLKVYYLPQDPSRNVALCCTTSRIRNE